MLQNRIELKGKFTKGINKMEKPDYKEGINMEQFHHIKEISFYNHNYYIGFGTDLLFGKSDDDMTTEWWLVNGNTSIYLGESHAEDEVLHRYETINR